MTQATEQVAQRALDALNTMDRASFTFPVIDPEVRLAWDDARKNLVECIQRCGWDITPDTRFWSGLSWRLVEPTSQTWEARTL